MKATVNSSQLLDAITIVNSVRKQQKIRIIADNGKIEIASTSTKSAKVITQFPVHPIDEQGVMFADPSDLKQSVQQEIDKGKGRIFPGDTPNQACVFGIHGTLFTKEDEVFPMQPMYQMPTANGKIMVEGKSLHSLLEQILPGANKRGVRLFHEPKCLHANHRAKIETFSTNPEFEATLPLDVAKAVHHLAEKSKRVCIGWENGNFQIITIYKNWVEALIKTYEVVA